MYICTKCNSSNVESLQWVDLNTGEADAESDVQEFYCRDCGAHTDVEWKQQPWEDDEDELDEKIEDTPTSE
jgi:hypothetical protein